MNVELNSISDGIKIQIIEHNGKYYFAENYDGKNLIGYEIGELKKKRRFKSDEQFLGAKSTKDFGGGSLLDECFTLKKKDVAYQKYKAACDSFVGSPLDTSE